VSTRNEVADESLAARSVVDHLLDRPPPVAGIPVAKIHHWPQLDVRTEGAFQLGSEVVWNPEGVRLLEVRWVVHLGRVALDPVSGVARKATVLAAD